MSRGEAHLSSCPDLIRASTQCPELQRGHVDYRVKPGNDEYHIVPTEWRL
jgi:hypothetical protein